MGVRHIERPGRGVAGVRDEGRRGDIVCLRGEFGILPCRHGFLVQHGDAVGTEHAQAGAIGVTPALLGEIVGRIQQPEGRRYQPATGVQTEQSAHDLSPPDEVP